jgi:hypothetical protein
MMNREQTAVMGEGKASRKMHKFELKADGDIERVGPFGSYGPTVVAHNKTEAQTKFLQFAFRTAEHTPRVKICNGAYQLAYESLEHGINVECGVDGRHTLCCAGVSEWTGLNDSVASFDYYASEAYKTAL